MSPRWVARLFCARSRLLALEHTKRIVPGANGIHLPTIVADGRVNGMWRRTETNGLIEVVPEAFGAI